MKKNLFNAGHEFWEPFEYEVHNLPTDVSYYVGWKTLNLILEENLHCTESLLVDLKAEFEKIFSIGYTFGKLGKTKARRNTRSSENDESRKEE